MSSNTFLLQNTEILRALQKASGLSPDAEPIKLLSVPKGALGNEYQITALMLSTLPPREGVIYFQLWNKTMNPS